MIERNRGSGRPKKKWMYIIREHMKSCGVDENMIRDKYDKDTNS